MQSSFSKDSSKTLNNNTSSLQESGDSQNAADIGLATSIKLNSLRQIVQVTRSSWEELAGESGQYNRTLAHITMIVVVILAVGVRNLDLSWGTISAVQPLRYDFSRQIEPGAVAEESTSLTLPTELINSQDDILVRGAVPRTIIPDRTRVEPEQEIIRNYFVETGDTISGIAEKFGLNIETIIWANRDLENNPDLLWVGQELTILPVDGVYHQVGSGDTIDGIASTFKVDPETIINYPLNELDPENLIIQPGDWLVVPGGNKPFVPRTVSAYSGPVPEDATLGSGIFGWPTSGSITNGYYAFHPGLDIGGWAGAPILAADSGHVVVSGWDSTGYGNMIVIDHSNGFQTLYAHLNSVYVEAGTNVAKGQQIGEMGSTGNSTGPHLHFEIRQGTVQRNPYGFLP